MLRILEEGRGGGMMLKLGQLNGVVLAVYIQAQQHEIGINLSVLQQSDPTPVAGAEDEYDPSFPTMEF
jgi:hypothetical protein